MIIMDMLVDNFLAFRNFHVNFSYPKKIVDSYIENEHLKGHTNFRYKKVNIIMGANASGKTSLGRIMMNIAEFIETKRFECLTENISDIEKQAVLSMDFIGSGDYLYNISVVIAPCRQDKYSAEDINVCVKKTKILSRDSYESCKKRLDEIESPLNIPYVEELKKIEKLSYCFQYPVDTEGEYSIRNVKNIKMYCNIMENILKALDPAIDRVEALTEVDNSFVIRMGKRSFILKDGELTNKSVLSSGTKSGIAVADIMYAIKAEKQGLYYCDEKFSYIHSDMEKAIISVMINALTDNDQLFFTTHNTDMLDLPLPKHSFMFLKKDVNQTDMPITCISATKFLKKNTDSVRNAVENDLFSTAPATDFIFEIDEGENE